MKISTKGRYALRLMVDLSIYNTGEPVSLKDVAKRQEISEKYLEQIISILTRGHLVKSIRGAQGGYILSRDPKDYTVGEILRLTEGDLAPVNCVSNNGADCERRNGCSTIRLWNMIYDAVSSVVDKITLEDLVEWQSGQDNLYSI